MTHTHTHNAGGTHSCQIVALEANMALKALISTRIGPSGIVRCAFGWGVRSNGGLKVKSGYG